MVIRWSEVDQVYMATLPEFDDAATHGVTYEKAAKQGRLLIESLIMWYEQDGKPLPEPNLFDIDAWVERNETNAPEGILK
jgi:predicted RNase H-like HicB family nuclease